MIEYGTNENWVWEGNTETVRFEVTNNGERIVCRVSRECIEDNLGDPKSAEACLDAAKAQFDLVTDIVGKLIASGRFEHDNSILIRSSDWPANGRTPYRDANEGQTPPDIGGPTASSPTGAYGEGAYGEGPFGGSPAGDRRVTEDGGRRVTEGGDQIVTEGGDPIVTEAGDQIVTEGGLSFGGSAEAILVKAPPINVTTVRRVIANKTAILSQSRILLSVITEVLDPQEGSNRPPLRLWETDTEEEDAELRRLLEEVRDKLANFNALLAAQEIGTPELRAALERLKDTGWRALDTFAVVVAGGAGVMFLAVLGHHLHAAGIIPLEAYQAVLDRVSGCE